MPTTPTNEEVIPFFDSGTLSLSTEEMYRIFSHLEKSQTPMDGKEANSHSNIWSV